MLFTEYQALALQTDMFKDLQVSTEGLASEVGSVLSLIQTQSLLKSTFTAFEEQIQEKLGDCLWYISSIASIFDLSLCDVAWLNTLESQVDWNKKNHQDVIKKFKGKIDDMNIFQDHVNQTDKSKNKDISVFGLVGENGSIATITKKILRRQAEIPTSQSDMKKELGDALW